MSLEEGVQKLTQAPANLMGLKDRGVLRKGFRADLVIFDPDTIEPTSTMLRNDLPGGEMRLYSEAEGIAHVIVNGRSIIEGGMHTGALPGRVLRSGVDTGTRLPGKQSLN
jgi:N-acyl-D-aspartate/D-glutamate deacylase